MRLVRRLRPTTHFEWMVFAVILAGASLRVFFWVLHMPSPKVYFIFNPRRVDTIPYLLSFESSHPIRMPYYDVFAYWFYSATEWFLGLRAVALFDLLTSIAALPLFYLGVRNLFDRKSALYALSFLAFYPKILIMIAEAMPEVAAVSFAAMSLYPISKTIENERPQTAIIAGLTATLAFLMFDPAVAFLGLTVLLLYAERAESLLDWTAIDRVQVAYTAPGAIIGLLYIVLGPFLSALRVGVGGDAGFGTGTRELFLQPESLPLLEKISRFSAYTYFDFWWHVRGFDTEGMILNLLSNISGFIGPLFPAFLIGWTILTFSLTVAIGAGIVVILQRRKVTDAFVLVWFVGYVMLFLGTNLGWQGAFQTRHVFPILPAIAILFGIGTAHLGNILANRTPVKQISSLIPSASRRSEVIVFLGTICFIFAILLAASAGQVIMLSDNAAARDRQPIEHLEATVGEGKYVATASQISDTNYREMILYSGGQLQPVVLTTNESHATRIREQTVGIDVKSGSPSELMTQLDRPTHLFIQSTCNDFGPHQQAFLQTAIADGGTVVHESHTVTGQVSPCEVNVVIVRVNRTVAGG